MTTPLRPPLAESKRCKRCDGRFAIDPAHRRAWLCAGCKVDAQRKCKRNWDKHHRARRADLVRVTQELLELRQRIAAIEDAMSTGLMREVGSRRIA
jgi:hypothetical protein